MNKIKKLRHELNYLKAENLFQIFVFLMSILPSMVYTLLVKFSRKKIWLICEDKMEARDNGICFFSYLNFSQDAKDIISYYAISYRSKDYPYVKSIGRVVRYGSVFHWMLYFASEYNISTQKAGKPDAAIGYILERSGLWKRKFIFLQHGITINRAEWLFYKNTKMRLFICGAEPEYQYISKVFGYPKDSVKYLGMCRFDSYFNQKYNNRQMVLMPSWREWIGSKNEYSQIFEDTANFRNTEYYRTYQSLLNNKKLIRFLKDHNITMFFYPHRNMQKFIKLFSTPCRNIQIVSNQTSDIRKLLIESAVMITDYSSVGLDFAYMKKPVIYYQFDEERFRKAQYKEGYFHYRNANLGAVFQSEKDVVDEVIRLFQTDFALDQRFYQAHQAFFPIWDNKNCERTFQAIKGLSK